MPLRPSILSGSFYPAETAALAASVDSLLESGVQAARNGGFEPVKAAITILPHAGHMYCGRIIGETLARTRLPERLILLAPSHTGRGAPLSVWPEGQWDTPLGAVPVDAALAKALIESGGGYAADLRAHAGEHSIEVLLPFLQRCVPSLRIVPVVASCHPNMLQQAGEALARAMAGCPETERPAIIVSSDLHHYGDEETTRALDATAIDRILDLDPAGLYNTIMRDKISMCGVQPATLALFAGRALGLHHAELVAHTTSAEASGDTSRVVGYAGIHIW